MAKKMNENPLKPLTKREKRNKNYKNENPYVGKKNKKASKKTGK